jgi:OOP family OmpA-OmpF porin
MKSILKEAALSVTGVLLASCAFAQTPDANYVKPFSGDAAFRTWSIGVHAGILSTYTPLQNNSRQDFMSTRGELGYGAYVKKQITSGWALQADYLGGKISAYNSSTRPAPFNNSAYSGVATSMQYAVSLSSVFTVGNINWHYKSTGIQPYLSAGGGMMSYKPVLTPSDGTAPLNFGGGKNINEFYIPVGVGLKFNVSDGVNIDLGYQTSFVNGDNLDGYNFGSNNDRFSYAHLGLEFAFGPKGKKQLASHNPVNSMRDEYLADEQRLQMAIDAQKAQSDQLRNELNAAKSEMNANLAKFTADSDGDGVPDFLDKCAGTPSGTKVDGSGCPLPVAVVQKSSVVVITAEDRKVVSEAIKNLEFDFGKSTIRARSFASLDRVAQLLIDKNFSLKLAGHTDNVGSDNANLSLSKDRAESIKNYLVGKGANASRIEATGYGESQPIATNKTAAGRQQNRRVEFSLF